MGSWECLGSRPAGVPAARALLPNAGVGGTPPRSQRQPGGGAALAAAEEDKRPPAAESKIAAERNAPGCAKEMFLPQISLLSEVNKANPTSSLCCSITLTSLCSEGRMVDSGKERAKGFPVSAFIHYPPVPICLPFSLLLLLPNPLANINLFWMLLPQPLFSPGLPSLSIISLISLCLSMKYVVHLSTLSTRLYFLEDTSHILVMSASCVCSIFHTVHAENRLIAH